MIAYKVTASHGRSMPRCYCDGCGADVPVYGLTKEAIARLSAIRPEGPQRAVGRPANYEDYLMSDQWLVLSEKVKERDGWRCRLCNSIKSIQAHHRTYERFGSEELDDLTTLCSDCHSWHHARQKASELTNFLSHAGVF